jgi:hypothetical protein
MAAATRSALVRFVCADSSERYEAKSADSFARAKYRISSTASSSRLAMLSSQVLCVVQEVLRFLAHDPIWEGGGGVFLFGLAANTLP